jgi:transcription initiation factor TFIIIB Brf1 subunit/transcription initiation factor TFIIB
MLRYAHEVELIDVSRAPTALACAVPPRARASRWLRRSSSESRGDRPFRGQQRRAQESAAALDVANEGPRTLDEVAEVLGVSGERVRQIEEEALEHLKHNATLKELYDESPE